VRADIDQGALVQTTTETTTARSSLDIAAPARGGWSRFARHFAEMIAAMVLGMLVLGGAIAGAVSASGASIDDAPIAVSAFVMALTMTVPMVAWMHYRHRMAAARCVEMAASMIVPTLLAVGLYWADALSSHDVMMVQHVVMIPAMLGVMLWRRPAYSH
jgi:hypothetical protein